ncbi:MAG: hypothetical protein D3904_01700 [Candidatus Electrothrix sp. EH2]|nr:hypothetical protein [Candidatus Electrothrix sp. EH2]
MKIEKISETDTFSYKNSDQLDNNRYILAVRDVDSGYSDRNLFPVLYYNNGEIFGIDTYDIDKILTSKYNPDNDKKPPITERFMLEQLVKISNGYIQENRNRYEGSNLPKAFTYQDNTDSFNINEIIEVFEGEIDESKGRVKIKEERLHSLITDLYIEEGSSFFIIDNKKIIGPFKAINKDIEGYFKVEKSSWKKFGEYELSDDSFIEFDANQITRRVIFPTYNRINILDTLDFKSDDDLIAEFVEKINNEDFVKKESVRQEISRALKCESSQNYINQNKRLRDILQHTDRIINSDIELANIIPEIERVKEKINKLKDEKLQASNHKNLLLLENEKLEQSIQKKENENKELEDKLLKIKDEINNLDQAKGKELASSNLESDLKMKRQELKNLDEEIRDKRIELKLRQEDIENLKNEHQVLSSTTKLLKNENLTAQQESQRQMIELFRHKKYFDFLSGRDLSEFEKKEKEPSDFTVKEDDEKLKLNYQEFRDQVYKILRKHGRKFDLHFVDNLLISIHQNTLTIFAGLPGTGKTSLARILVSILSPKERNTEVSVHRGWTSQKDLIGFQNPISNNFNSAPTGVYDILWQLDSEVEREIFDDSPLAYIILDEANLSPIEHYWSTFYNLTDSYASIQQSLSIQLGDSVRLKYANNLRFIATVNYDRTTEMLSPRVIDRANIIQIPRLENVGDILNEEIECLHLTYKKCREYFKLMDYENKRSEFRMSEELDRLFAQVKDSLSTLQIVVSPRAELSIKKYCTVASTWMREIPRPLDYCIAQRVLPYINIQGDKAKTDLTRLLDIFKENDLRISKDILEKIIYLGDDDRFFEGNYNYFLTLTHAQNI